MKKFLGVFLVSVLLISGCSGSKEKADEKKAVTCTLEQDGSKIDYELGYDDNKIINKIKGTIVAENEEEIDDEQMEMFETLYSSMFDEIEGMDYELSLNEDNRKEITIVLSIDLKEYNAEEDALGIFTNMSDKEDITKAKVDDIVTGLEDSGAECGKVK